MDIVSHTLASAALVRALFPRASWMTWAAALVSGSIADIDLLSIWFGPAAFLSIQGTYTHSMLGTLALAALVCGLLRLLRSAKGEMAAAPAAAFTAAALHLAMDACQSVGMALWWPLSGRRIALDWLANLDPWILLALIAGIALPELLRLVGSEIGAKEKNPRGRNGAIAAFVAIFLYAGARATLHSSAVAQLGQHTYRGELPRRVAAFPEPVSLFTWHGIVETESSLHELNLNVGSGGPFNPEASLAIHKPEASRSLDAALATNAAQRFLRVARLPKASVERTDIGTEVMVRDLAREAAGESSHETVVEVRLDVADNVASQEIAWARNLPRR